MSSLTGKNERYYRNWQQETNRKVEVKNATVLDALVGLVVLFVKLGVLALAVYVMWIASQILVLGLHF